MAWFEFLAAFAVFFFTHSVPIRPPVKPWLVARLGPTGYRAAYSALSLVVLVWLVGAAGRAPHVPLWDTTAALRVTAFVLMVVAVALLALSVGIPNPFSFGGVSSARFDPAHPGVIRLTRHPLLTVLAIWAVAHLLANGDVAHVILFGTFAVFAIMGHCLIDRRKRREKGADWARLRASVVAVPWSRAVRSVARMKWRLVLGLAGYTALIILHPVILGVDPLP